MQIYIGQKLMSQGRGPGSGGVPFFVQQPEILPGTGDVGTVFTLTRGKTQPQDAVRSFALTLDGVDVSSEIYLDGGVETYTSTAQGVLALTVTATNAEGAGVSETVTATVTAAVDTQAPSLSGLVATVTGETTADVVVVSDEVGGVLSLVASQSATVPTAAQVMAGQDASGAAAVSAAQPVTATGMQILALSGLSASTTYTVHAVQTDAASNVSAVLSSATITTDAAPVAPAAMAAPVVVSTGADSLSVSLAAAPDDGGASIQRYDLRSSTDQSAWSESLDIADPQTLSGLAQGTLYFVQTRAVNAVGAGGWSPSASATTDILAPVNTTAPVISGSTGLGDTLIVSDGTWTGQSLTFTYQWHRDGGDIAGATGQSYTIAIADDAALITCDVTATNAAGVVSQTSNALSVDDFIAPVVAGMPALDGEAFTGQTLTAGAAGVTGTPTPVRTWQWMRDGADIAGATTVSYTLVAADEGAAISVRQTETNALGSDSAVSVPSDIVQTLPLPTILTVIDDATDTLSVTYDSGTTLYVATCLTTDTPTTAQVFAGAGGGILEAFSNTLGGQGPEDFTFALTAATGATGNSRRLAVVVESTAGQLSDVSYSDFTVDLTAPALSLAVVANPGETTADWSVDTDEGDGTLYWAVTLLGDAAPDAAAIIAGAGFFDAGSEPVLAIGTQAGTATGLTAETGYRLSFVHVDAHRNPSSALAVTFTTAAATSAPVISGLPVISGTETEGETLTATAASVTGTPPPTTTWQWERSGTPISGATAATYVLVAGDVGETITVVQTATNSAGSDTAISAATGTIGAAASSYINRTAGAGEASASSHSIPLPTHASGDFLVVAIAISQAGGYTAPAVSGWTVEADRDSASTSYATVMLYSKTATSSTCLLYTSPSPRDS